MPQTYPTCSVNINYFSVFRVIPWKEGRVLNFSLFSFLLSFFKKKKIKCDCKAVEFGSAPPDDAFTLLYGKNREWIRAYCRCRRVLSCPSDASWLQIAFLECAVGSHPGMTATCWGSWKDLRRQWSLRLRGVLSGTPETPSVRHFASAGESEHLRVTGP